MNWSSMKYLGSIASIFIILIPMERSHLFKMEVDKRQQKMDVLSILKEWFVEKRLCQDSDGSVLSPHLFLLAQHLAHTGHSINNHQFMWSRQKRGIPNLTLSHMAPLTMITKNI